MIAGDLGIAFTYDDDADQDTGAVGIPLFSNDLHLVGAGDTELNVVFEVDPVDKVRL